MKGELFRLGQYSTFPSCPVSPIRLARGGFVPTGNGDEVQCNKCQLKHSNWRTGDDPLQIHRQASPGCPFFNSRSDNELPSDSGDGINIRPNIEAPEGQPRYHRYSTYDQRISTFTTWPSSKSQKPEDMAGAGLFYTGNGDRVRCFHCGIGFENWMTEDNPWHEHERWSTNCHWIKKIIGDAQFYGFSIPSHTQQEPPRSNTTETSPEHIPENDSGDGINIRPNIEAPERIEGQPRYHLYSTYNQRISTFTTWPSSKSQKPEDMAGAGLFYTGIGDCVRCFHCGIGLEDWGTEDNPWHEHERWSTNCHLVKKIIGEAQFYGFSISSHTQQEPPRSNTTETSPEHIPENDEELFKHSAVQSIQEMGYSDDFIRKACARLRSNKGKMVFCAVNLMKVIFTMEEEDDSETAKRCKVCFEGDLEMVLLPCGHLVVCATCAARLQTCPVCRANISGTVKVYMA